MRSLLRTTGDPTLLVARLALGTMLVAHGAQDALGMFGGRGYAATLQVLASQGVATWLGWGILAVELVGGVLLLAGFCSRLVALLAVLHMAATAYRTAWPYGFFMNWTNAQRGEGVEFHLVAIALALVILSQGSGPLSIDRAMAGGSKRR